MDFLQLREIHGDDFTKVLVFLINELTEAEKEQLLEMFRSFLADKNAYVAKVDDAG